MVVDVWSEEGGGSVDEIEGLVKSHICWRSPGFPIYSSQPGKYSPLLTPKDPGVLASVGESESEETGTGGSRLIVDTSLRLNSTWWSESPLFSCWVQDHEQPVLYFPDNQSHSCRWTASAFQSPILKGKGDLWIIRNFDKNL